MGVGQNAGSKAFDTVMVGDKKYELIHGEFPHSRNDNTMYVRSAGGQVTGFDGFRRPFRIEIEEYNYIKRSGLSGDEVRKGCNVKVYCGGIQIYDEFARGYEMAYKKADEYIRSLELMLDWFPFNAESKVGKVIGYREQLFKINIVLVSQGCFILETVDGKPRKRFLYEDEEDTDEYELSDTLKVEITIAEYLLVSACMTYKIWEYSQIFSF